MTGNVREWCEDWYDSQYYFISPVKEPQGPPNKEYKVIRGGSYIDVPYHCRVSSRGKALPENYEKRNGFRIVFDD